MGTREAGFASSMPGYRKFESAADREELAALWNVAGRAAFPTARGLAYPDIIEAALDRRVRALWIIATNPIVSFPNLGVLKQALETLEFLVVQDGFHPTPTTELADLVLPAAIWGEKEGTYTNSERRVSKVNRAVEPPGEARSGLRHLPRPRRARSDAATSCFPGWTTPEDAFDEWKRVSAGPPVRLLRHDLRGDRSARRHPVAVSRRRARCGGDAPALRRRPLSDRRTARRG